MSTNSCPQKLSRPLVFAPTSTWSRPSVRMASTSECVSTPSTSCVSTRCCRVPVPIVCKPVWEVPSVNHKVQLPVSTLARPSCLSDQRTLTRHTALRPSDAPSSSFQDVRRYHFFWAMFVTFNHWQLIGNFVFALVKIDLRLKELRFHQVHSWAIRWVASRGQTHPRRCRSPIQARPRTAHWLEETSTRLDSFCCQILFFWFDEYFS